ncbi:MAG: imidazole glycerol phosphate synthase subunit HisH [Deltaproteobacteria bacterium]|nr:imidazole glycerol phosphate synthase subunit HisH [Deltaproteobacteria bacterium]
MITIVSYGLGNVRAFANSFERMHVSVNIATSAHELRDSTHLILPGVGSFDWAVQLLTASGLREPLNELVLEKKRLVLGVCVGMQMMALSSEEGALPGLGWIDAQVKKFSQTTLPKRIYLPHMGWNDVIPKQSECLFHGLESGARFYFLHSYYVTPRKKDDVLAITDYNGSFASSVRCGNIFGVQFHPEKSHQWGIQLLKNFAEL